MALIKCKECGKEYSSNAKACPKCGNPTIEEPDKKTETNISDKRSIDVNINEKPKKYWSTGKLVISIISMVLFIIITFQSCAAGLSNTISNNNSDSGTLGFFCALFTLIGGIITMATRNSEGKGGCIAAIIFYWLGALMTSGTGSTYPDLPIWGSIAFAFGMINLGSLLMRHPKLDNQSTHKIILFAVIGVSIIGFIYAVSNAGNESKKETKKPSTNVVEPVKQNAEEKTQETDHEENTQETNNEENIPGNGSYGLGDKFIFDELEITLGKSISFTKVNNKYSDYNKKTVVKIPVTIKNLKDETHSLNMFDYKVFGSKGTEVKTVSSYFKNDVDHAGDLRTGASYTKYFYFIYDGNGTYAIEFDDWSTKIMVEFEVKK